jgi:formylglycine-generating enzyme required for sulfatase activity
MTRHAAEEFCRWLSKKTGKTYRLPTETEWAYACLAGVVDDKHVTPAELAKQAWSADNSDEKTHPVGTKTPNAWGLHDMAGNVAEWVTPVHGDKNALVVRGGSYNDPAEDVGCGARATQDEAWNETDPQDPKSKWWLSDAPFVGFRVVQED